MFHFGILQKFDKKTFFLLAVSNKYVISQIEILRIFREKI